MPAQRIKVGYIDTTGSSSGQVPSSNGTAVTWANTTQNLTVYYSNNAIAFSGMGTGTAYVTNAAGSNTQVQFNSSGVFAGSAGLTFDTSTNTITTGVASLFGGANAITFTNATSNWIQFGTGGVAAPTANTRSAGSKLVLYEDLSTNSTGYAIGIENGHMWFNAGGGGGYGFKWYSNTTNFAIANTTGLIPGASNTYDLGTSSLRWRTIYTNDLELSNGIGDYTIVEGEDDLFIYNNKKGKVYKFALIEVDPSEAPKKAK